MDQRRQDRGNGCIAEEVVRQFSAGNAHCHIEHVLRGPASEQKPFVFQNGSQKITHRLAGGEPCHSACRTGGTNDPMRRNKRIASAAFQPDFVGLARGLIHRACCSAHTDGDGCRRSHCKSGSNSASRLGKRLRDKFRHARPRWISGQRFLNLLQSAPACFRQGFGDVFSLRKVDACQFLRRTGFGVVNILCNAQRIQRPKQAVADVAFRLKNRRRCSHDAAWR